jgi:hypothetical protein
MNKTITGRPKATSVTHDLVVVSLAMSLLAAVLSTFAAEVSTAQVASERFLTAYKLAPPDKAQDRPPTRASAPTKAPCDRTRRSVVDRPDAVENPQQVHVVYAVPSDFPDERLDTNGAILCSVLAADRWFAQQSGGLHWRFDTYVARTGGRPTFSIDITFVRSERSGSELAGDLEGELHREGLNDPDKIYLVYVAADNGSVCGQGVYPIVGDHGGLAAVYLFSDTGCHGHDLGAPGKPSWADGIAVHELAHTQGVVPIGAPHGCNGLVDPVPIHICTQGLYLSETAGLELDPERTDLMFPFVTEPLSGLVLDRDRDDYFDHPFPHLRDLKKSPFLMRRATNSK